MKRLWAITKAEYAELERIGEHVPDLWHNADGKLLQRTQANLTPLIEEMIALGDIIVADMKESGITNVSALWDAGLL